MAIRDGGNAGRAIITAMGNLPILGTAVHLVDTFPDCVANRAVLITSLTSVDASVCSPSDCIFLTGDLL